MTQATEQTPLPHFGKEKAYKGYEEDLQEACANWLYWQHQKALWLHPPNEGKRTPQTGKKLKKAGMRKGASDFIFLEPRSEKAGLVIELKTDKGRLTDTQKIFLRDCEKRNYRIAVCWNFEAFKKIVDEYLTKQ